MLGFKEYLITSFDILLTARIKNFFLLYYGKILPLLVEDYKFFIDGFGNEKSVEEGVSKTIEIYTATDPSALTSLLYPAGVTFEQTMSSSVRKYYKLAAEFLLENDMLVASTQSTGINNPLEIKFFEELYKFKRDLSLAAFQGGPLSYNLDEYETKAVRDFYEFLKTKGPNTLFGNLAAAAPPVYVKTLNSAIAGNESIVNSTTKYSTDEWIKDTKSPLKESTQKINKIVDQSPTLKRYNQLLKIFQNLTEASRCTICKRGAFKGGNSLLYFVEQKYGKLGIGKTQGTDPNAQPPTNLIQSIQLGQALNCQSVGYDGFRGNVEGAEVKGLAAGKCPVEPIKEVSTTLKYGKTELQKSLTAVDYKSQYFLNLLEAIQEINDKIDKNLITLIDGE